MESGEWRVESGEWRVESGEWRVESGEGRGERGEGRGEVSLTHHYLWCIPSPSRFSHSSPQGQLEAHHGPTQHTEKE